MGTSAAGRQRRRMPRRATSSAKAAARRGSVREHLNDAKNLEEDGSARRGAESLRTSLCAQPQPSVLYRMAGLHDQLNHPRQALNLYRRYMAQNPQMSEERQVEVAANIARLSLAIQDGSSRPQDRAPSTEPADGQ